MGINIVSFKSVSGRVIKFNPVYVTYFVENSDQSTDIYISTGTEPLQVMAGAQEVEEELTGMAEKKRQEALAAAEWNEEAEIDWDEDLEIGDEIVAKNKTPSKKVNFKDGEVGINIVSFNFVGGRAIKFNPVYVTHFVENSDQSTDIYISTSAEPLQVMAGAQEVEEELTGMAEKKRQEALAMADWG